MDGAMQKLDGSEWMDALRFGSWILDAGYLILDNGCWMQESEER